MIPNFFGLTLHMQEAQFLQSLYISPGTGQRHVELCIGMDPLGFWDRAFCISGVYWLETHSMYYVLYSFAWRIGWFCFVFCA